MRSAVAAGRACACLLLLLAIPATPVRALEAESAALRMGRAENVTDASVHAVDIELKPESVPRPLSLLGDNLSYDLTLGYINQSADSNIGIEYLHFGPTWHYRPAMLWDGAQLSFGTAVTRLSRDELQGRVLGGRWHFTSHLTLAHDFGRGRRWHAAIRLQHTSNASTQAPNPGLDVPMLELGYHF